MATRLAEDVVNEREIEAAPPPAGYRSFWTDLRHVAFSQQWLEVKGRRIRYLRAGDPESPAVIMLPGTGGHAESFIANLGALAAHFDVWALDMIGHGYSDRPDVPYDTFYCTDFLKDFYDVAGIERAHLVGCSVGSWHALRMALRFPALVDRIIMLAPIGGPTADEGDAWYDFWMKWPALAPPLPEGEDGGELRLAMAAKPTWENSQAIVNQLIRDPRGRTDDLVAARLDVNLQPRAAETAKHVVWWHDLKRRAANSLSRDELRSIRNPVLGGIGEIEGVRPMVHEMFKCLPRGELVIWNGVGHWPQYEDPTTFNQLAIEFLSR